MRGTPFDLSGRVALVTGGSKGLGKAMARGFVEAGADVFISSRHEDELKSAAEEIRQGTKARCEYLVADMTNRDDAARLAQEATKRMGRVDILVNNAGSNNPQAIDQITDADWDRILELNLSSCMALTRAVVPQMKERRWGRVIHISSIMGLASKQGRNAYSATKAALIGMARASALDLGTHNITVNCLAPGPFMTDLPGSLLSDAEKKVFAQRTALGRWGEPRELAGPRALAGQRRRKLHHRGRARCRRRIAVHDVLDSSRPEADQPQPHSEKTTRGLPLLVALVLLPLAVIVGQLIAGSHGPVGYSLYKFAFLLPPILYCRWQGIGVFRDILKFRHWRNGLGWAAALSLGAALIFAGAYWAWSDVLIDEAKIVEKIDAQFGVSKQTVLLVEADRPLVAPITILLNSLWKSSFIAASHSGCWPEEFAHGLPAAGRGVHGAAPAVHLSLGRTGGACAGDRLAVRAVAGARVAVPEVRYDRRPWVVHIGGDVAMMGIALTLFF